jgi:hypothetical protein
MANGAVGPAIEVPGRFTHCVNRSDYRPLTKNAAKILFQTGVGSWAKAFCDYLLGGKLICLGNTECAVGHVVGIEPVGFGKPFPDDIDNDFSFNLLLAPHTIDDFAGAAKQLTFVEEAKLPAEKQANFLNQKIVAEDGMQGRLIVDPSKSLANPDDWPDPLEKEGGLKSTGYAAPPVVYVWGSGGPKPYIPSDDKSDRLRDEATQDADHARRVPIPVLHCECEGSRPFQVCQAIGPFLDLASGKLPGVPGPSASEVCHATLGWIPFVGDAICSLIEDAIVLALAPVALAAAAAAWFGAQVIDDVFFTGPISGEIALGDAVAVTGRWVWDAGHSGWPELHAVHTVQKLVIPPEFLTGARADPKALEDFRRHVCHLVGEAPPNFGTPNAPRTVPQVAAMTPEQRVVHERQQQPENRWRIHPLIDGCEGEPPAPPPPPVR